MVVILMRHIASILFLGVVTSTPAWGQVTITADDMFTKPGEYYIAYSNDFDPTSLLPTPFPVPSNVIGSAGPNQVWDFSKGPTNVRYRFDYLPPADVGEEISGSFSSAKVVERKTNEDSGNSEFLFFEQVAGLGRRVYGFYAENPLFDPANVFEPPIVDFPAQIRFGDEWSTSTTWYNSIGGITPPDPEDPDDGGGGFSLAARNTHTSTLKADAWGTIVLPDELGGFGQGLRITESVTIDVAIGNDTGGYDHLETNYARNYYWFMPGRGMVAALASTHTTTPTPENFTTATQFWRMFETNKKPTVVDPTCTTPGSVKDLRIRFSGGQVLLTWGQADCASQYQVQYSTNVFDQASWKPLGNTVTSQLVVLDATNNDVQRFYRVVSMK